MRVVSLVVFFLLSVPVLAKEALTDHPLLSAYQGSTLTRKQVKEFDEHAVFTGLDAQGKPTGPLLEGRITTLFYRNPKDRSILEIHRNYANALNAEGMEILHQCDQKKHECVKAYAQSALGAFNGLGSISNTAGRYVAARLKRDSGDAYIAVAVGETYTEVQIVEIKAMQTGRVKVNAEALGKGIDKDGYVIVEGIYFDTDKTSLKPESMPALKEVSLLLQQRAALNLYVVGHTDMQGSMGHNIALSQGRARAVVGALVADFGVAADRLDGHGVGPLAPQASNGSESGRAKNRRVVLVAR